VTAMPSRTSTPTVPILLYHSVSDSPSSFIAPFTVSPDTFARHLDAVAASGATTLTVSELRAALDGHQPLPQRPVLVTFDDGFLDTLTVAAPLLAERGMSMTAYVTTGVVGGTSPGGDPMLSWSQTAELAASGAEIGGHSHTHPELDTLPVTALREETAGCRARLQDSTGLPINSFAYPFGYSDPRVRRVVQDAGFTSACSVKNALSAPHDPPFGISRLMVMSTTGDDDVVSWLSGNGAPVGRDDERVLTRGWRAWRRVRNRVHPMPGWTDAG
jgi:peptidoglycan/xylan/chitin deacetylase (PgdA/CDA1 family)